MRGKNRKSIEERKKFPQFTTMNVIDGQADIVNYASLIFYSLTIDNILNIIVMLILVAVTINVALNGGIVNKAKDASDKTNLAKEEEILQTTALGYLQKNSGFVDLEAFAEAYDGKLLEGYVIEYEEDATYATATKGGQTFYITKQGGITKTEPQTEQQSNVDPGEPGSGEINTGSGEEQISALQPGTRYNVTIGNLYNVEWDEVFTDDYLYMIAMIPNGVDVDTAMATNNMYQLMFSFKVSDNVLALDYATWEKMDNSTDNLSIREDGKWYEKEADSPTAIEVNNVLIIPEDDLNAGLALAGADNIRAVPDELIPSIINITAGTPSNPGD